MNTPMTIQTAAEALRAGDITSVELTQRLLARIEELNPTLGAFLHVATDNAIAEATAADAMFAAGIDRGPLQGIPYGVKDIIATQNAPTTANSLVLDRAWGAGYDATVIRRLRAAGAVMLGKTVLNEFAYGAPDPDKPFPMPQNPWDLPRTAAGSSSGSGIAVAAGLALGALGTDTGASTRGPAAVSGLTGMKQTYGRVPKWGCVPLGYSLDGINPMARSAYDCALMLNVIAGHDPKDPTTLPVPVPDYTATLDGSVAGMTIGVPYTYFFDAPQLNPEMREAVLQAVEVLKDLGATVKEVVVPHAAEAKDANTIIIAGEGFAYHQPDMSTRFADYGKYTWEVIARGLLLNASDYVQAQRFRTYFRAAIAELFEDIDVLITPTQLGPAALRSEMNATAQLTNPGFTGQWNLAGIPAMAVPVGFSSNGLPLSMQIVSAAFDEAAAFRVGDAYQRATDWHLRVPTHARGVAV
ncbi:MAG: amidase [Dehalococcoidia bacterium]